MITGVAGVAGLAQLDMKNLVAIKASRGGDYANHAAGSALTSSVLVRRLTAVHSGSTGDTYDPTNTNLDFKLVFTPTGSTDSAADYATDDIVGFEFTQMSWTSVGLPN